MKKEQILGLIPAVIYAFSVTSFSESAINIIGELIMMTVLFIGLMGIISAIFGGIIMLFVNGDTSNKEENTKYTIIIYLCLSFIALSLYFSGVDLPFPFKWLSPDNF